MPPPPTPDGPLLALEDLRVAFDTAEGAVEALRGVSLAVRDGEVLAIVGESGCGKSLTSLAVMGLLPQPPGRIAGGRILFEGQDLTRLSPAEMRKIRGNRISMIFQEPMTSLNPVLTVGAQIAEAIVAHRRVRPAEARALAIETMQRVSIADPERRFDEYPHQFSGGMRQRVMIAMALACQPRLLIADEPTTALDVTIQAQVLDLMLRLRAELGMAIILITHDLGVVAEAADRVAVMYGGRIVESATVDALFDDPCHPYTRQLLAALPSRARRGTRLAEIPGMVPPLSAPAPGCGFCPRLAEGDRRCRPEVPDLVEPVPGHFVRCWSAPQRAAAAA